MENPVIITFIISVLIGWVSYLIYRYRTFDKSVAVESRVNYWYNKYHNLQSTIDDLIKDIHKIFPKSTIEYIHNDEIDSVQGEIKY